MFLKRNFFNADFASLLSGVPCESNIVDFGVASTVGVIEMATLEGSAEGMSGSIRMGSSLYDLTPSISSQNPRLKIKLLASSVVPYSLR